LNISGSTAISNIRPLNAGSVDAVKAIERSDSKYSTKSIDDDFVELKSFGRSMLRDRGLSTSSIRAQESISLAQTADSSLESSQDTLLRMRDLATRSADTLNQDDRIALDLEYTQYKIELSELGTISFDGVKFEKTDTSMILSFQTDAGSDSTTDITINTPDISSLGDISTSAAAKDALVSIDRTMDEVSTARDELSDVRNKILNSMQSRDTTAKGPQMTSGRVHDADTARKIIDSIKNNLLSNSSSADFAQANMMPQGVIQLMGVG